MAEVEFKRTGKSKKAIMTVISAKAENPERILKVYIDNDTGEVIYPVAIKQAIPGIEIMLDSAESASCTLPPCISEEMIDRHIAYLATAHDAIKAARTFIAEELERMEEDVDLGSSVDTMAAGSMARHKGLDGQAL